MASGIVRSFLSSFFDEPDLSSRIQTSKQFITSVLQRIIDSDASMDSFDNFSYKLVSTLRSLFDTVEGYKSLSSKQERLWREFHTARSHSLPITWKELCKSIGIQYDQLAAQTVNMKIFKSFMKTYFASIPISEELPKVTSTFSDDELNALRYVSGYVPYKLLRKYEQCRPPCNKAPLYLECLGNMAVAGDDSDVHNYTTKWLDTVNRGGLFPINDKSFVFFLAIESSTVKLLTSTYKKLSSKELNIKAFMLEKLMQNEQIKLRWNALTEDIDFTEEDADHLLKEIISLWITIRGFSLAATWLETYKQHTAKNTKKTKSIRKTIKPEL